MIPGFPNIGPLNRLQRLGAGVLFLLAGVWAFGFLNINHFPLASRVVLFVPLYLGFAGVFEALFGYCLVHHHCRTYDRR
ncbi:MAG: hypothetical protein HY520_02360 [Candidatus Aenigmarchaeota archaeon]|nr:hypothetical protein [Candidatus Aenigmarchaeota archaeon]